MKTCPACGQTLPLPQGRLICSACSLPIRRGQGGWTHGSDGRPKHRDCAGVSNEPQMQLLETSK